MTVKCENVRGDIRRYMEDLVSESERLVIRNHLKSCGKCRDQAQTFGAFAGEIKKIVSEIELPAQLSVSILAQLKSAAGLGSAGKRISGYNKAKIFWKIFYSAVLLIVLAAGARMTFRQSSIPSVVPIPLSEKEPVVLSPPAARIIPDEPLEEVARKVKPLAVVALHPLHWHLQFPEADQRNRFADKVKSAGFSVEYDNDQILVLSLNQKELLRLLDLLSGFEKIKFQALIDRMRKLPDFEGKVSVSIILDASVLSSAAPRGIHWHVNLLLGNSIALLERLNEAGFTPVFNTPEFWVFELDAESFPDLRSELLGAYGVELEMTGEVNPPPGGGKFTVSFYIGEGTAPV